MPNVGGKKFAYTPEGEAAAAEYAQQTGAPFQMRAKAFNNSPMQKNFGSSLAINTQLDKDSGTGKTGQPGPVLKKLDITSKLLRQDMEGGLTGAPSTGDLDGPLKKKFPAHQDKPGVVKANKWSSSEAKAKRQEFRDDIKSFGTGLVSGIKEFGSQIQSGVKRVGKNIKKGKPLAHKTYLDSTKSKKYGTKGAKRKKKAHEKFLEENS